jgi:peptidoglycan/LPS O-acetylase OafA/YrhL
MLSRRIARGAGAPRGGADRPGSQGVLPRLTSLRAFAALAVFIYHLGAWRVAALPGGVSEVGAVGVAFFFVLSGFVLAWGTRPGLPALTFYRRRFARVYPSDLTMLLVAVVVPVVPVHRGVEAAVANALVVQAWYADPKVVYGMNGVSWSLSCEALFYTLFPVLVVVIRALPRWAGWALAFAGLVVAVVLNLRSFGFADHFPPIRATEFLLGTVAGLSFRDGWRPRVPGPVVALVLGTALAACTVVPPSMASAVMAAPFLLLILHTAVRDLDGRRGWLRSRVLVFAGEASFAFYLVHELTIVNLRTVLPEGSVGVLAISAVAVVAAALLHLVVERPLNRLLRDRAPSAALAVPGQPPVGGVLGIEPGGPPGSAGETGEGLGRSASRTP